MEKKSASHIEERKLLIERVVITAIVRHVNPVGNTSIENASRRSGIDMMSLTGAYKHFTYVLI